MRIQAENTASVAAETVEAKAQLQIALARIAELEAALKMSEQRFETLKNAWDKSRIRNVPIYGSAALAGGKDE